MDRERLEEAACECYDIISDKVWNLVAAEHRSCPPAAETLLSRLKDARTALDRAIAELERAGEHR